MNAVETFGGPNCVHGEYEFANRAVYAEYARCNDEQRKAWIADPRNAGRWRLKANPAPMAAPASLNASAPVVPPKGPKVPRYDEAAPYVECDWRLITLAAHDDMKLAPPHRGKMPTGGKAWNKPNYSSTDAIARAKQTGGNLGVLPNDEQLVLDVDIANGKPGAESLERLATDSGFDFSKAPRVNTGSGGAHYYMRKSREARLTTKSIGDRYPGIDIRADGAGQVVAAGSIHHNGNYYTWDTSHPPLSQAPTASDELLAMLCPKSRQVKRKEARERKKPAINQAALGKILAALPATDFGGGETWRTLLWAVHYACGGAEWARDAFIEWSASDPKFANDRAHTGDMWNRADAERTTAVTTGTLFHILKERGLAHLMPHAGWPDGIHEKTRRPLPFILNTIEAINRLDVQVRLDTFRHKQFVTGTAADEYFDGELSDAAVTMMRIEIRKRFGFYPGKDTMVEALLFVGRTNKCNPVVEMLKKLKWDGVARIDNALCTYLGAPNTAYVRAVSRKVFCGLVRRAKHPGCKFDHVLTLSGAQGIGKTRFCQDLAGDKSLYTDTSIIAHSAKESMEASGGKLVIEIGEMAGFNDHSREKVKAYITREDDRARMAYDRFAIDQPRACIFIATKNPGGIFNDPTGERRWWDVPVSMYDQESFLRDRDQLLAEAVACEPGEKLWLDDAAASAQHEEHIAGQRAPNELVDALARVTGKVIQGEERISAHAVRTALGITNVDTVRLHGIGRKIADAMAHLGWTKSETPIRCGGDHTERGFVRPCTSDRPELPL